MNEEAKTQKFFLIGIIGLGVLIIGGLVWAIMLPSGPTGPKVGSEVVFSDANDPVLGPATSTVTVRIFGDFQCPACSLAEPGVTYARNTYGDRVRFVWNDFPLSSLHQNAMVSALAARCAEAQGKFWEYHDQLYKEQKVWSAQADPKDLFAKYAGDLGMNVSDFSSCYASKTYAQKIQDDVAEGTGDGVNSTPTFFINNKMFVGALEPSQWDKEITAELNAPAAPKQTE